MRPPHTRRHLLLLSSAALGAGILLTAHGCSEDAEPLANPSSTSSSGNGGGVGASGGSGGAGDGGLELGGHSGIPDGPCSEHAGESFCDGATYYHCSGSGTVVSQDNCKVDGSCSPATCVDGQGCVRCQSGQMWCDGPYLKQCNTTVDPVVWDLVQTCSANQACDVKQGACVSTPTIGDTTPTGSYYQYAAFRFASGSPDNDVYLGGMDVGSYGDLLYVHREQSAYGASTQNPMGVDVYEVELLDSDGDGELEPNQHPDNPDNAGPVEERVLTLVETIQTTLGGMHCSEIIPFDDRMYSVQCQGVVTETIYASGQKTTVASGSVGASFLGYDDINDQWIVGNEGRQVHAFHGDSNQWVPLFRWPDLAGSHGDGLEVVTDPKTDTPYVYISDMTSDFLAQYRCDPAEGWVMENLFDYVGTASDYVEGMGFGALGHFWVSTLESGAGGWTNVLKEIGGGDIEEYTEEPPEEIPK